MTTITSPYLTIEQAAEYVGFSTKTIRRRIAAGKLPAVTFGGRTMRIARTDLEALARPVPTAKAA